MARYRPVFTEIWVCDNKFQDYSVEGKLLFLYLITNEHLEESGIYKITYKTMANETDIPKDKVIEIIRGELKNNVSYDDKNDVIFVHKFFKKSPGGNPELIKKSIEKGKRLINTTLWKEFYKYYTKDLKPIENSSEKDSSNIIPNSNDNSILKEDKEILNHLSKVKGYPFNKEKDLEFIQGLKKEFPSVDILEKVKQICINWLKFPLLKKSRPRVQIRKWVTNEKKWQKERDQVGKSTKKSTKEEDEFTKARNVQVEKICKSHEKEVEQAKKDGDKDKFDEIQNQIKTELAEWSREYYKEK